ncbi:hypothetical protein NRB_23180 [Novosphingobium sp. 11B]|uniref:Uncharacterized protein n=1 Tax=Novosphingobium resinovorum TaxID=158500 RepID=A0A1D8AB50_9SPHN|nr:hypothetical protein [Novosphingobium resinovorum]AOR79343.1 hypothetical protein BES08_21070 [Novosphingobium resinovorum]
MGRKASTAVGIAANWLGYKVVWFPFTTGRPSGKPREFVIGFIGFDGKSRGCAVGATYDPVRPTLGVADDLSNTVWRITPSG